MAIIEAAIKAVGLKKSAFNF